MAGEINLPYTSTGLNLYTVVRNANGQAWRTDTHVFENYTTANLASYAVSLTEQGVASAFYSGDFPALITARSVYGLAAYVQAGGSPAEGDTLAGAQDFQWPRVGPVAVDANGVADANVKQALGNAVTTATSGLLDVNVKQINTVTTGSVTTVGPNIGTTQPVNFTGTSTSAMVQTDALKLNGVATTPVTTIGANLGTTQPVNFSGTGGSALVKSDSTGGGGSAPTAAQVATAVWQDLTAGSDFTTVGSVGKLLATDIDAAISSRSTFAGGAVASVTGNVGGNVVGSVASVTARVTANTDQVAGDSTAATSLASQFNGTGLTGTTYPARQDQVNNIAVTSAALNQTAASLTLTTGTDTGGVANTDALDGVFDSWADDTGTIDGYYQFDISATTGAAATGVTWDGYLVGATNTLKVYAYNWNGTAWDQIGTITGTAGTVVGTQEFDLTNSHTGTGGNLGLVRIRFQNTGLTAATIKTDRILLGYVVVPAAVGITMTANVTEWNGHAVSDVNSGIPDVALANNVAHGGPPGSSGATFALQQLKIVNSTGTAFHSESTGGPGHGIYAKGGGQAYGLYAKGGTDGVNAGLRAEGGDGSTIIGFGGYYTGGGMFGGPGLYATGVSDQPGAEFDSGGMAAGIYILGDGNQPGIWCDSTTGPGAKFTGGGNSAGIMALGSGTGSAAQIGDGVHGGHGISVQAAGSSKHGILIQGGTAGTSDGIHVVAGTGGVDIRSNIQGDLGGRVLGNTSTAFSGVGAEVDLRQILGTVIPQTNAGQVATDFGFFFDVTPTTTKTVNDVGSSGGGVIIRSNTAQAGDSTSITLDSGASATDNLYRGELIALTGGTGTDQTRIIIAYDGTSKVTTVDRNWVVAPDNTTTFSILPADSVPFTPADVAAAMWTDLLAAGDFAVPGSIGDLLVNQGVTVGDYAAGQDPASMVLAAVAADFNAPSTVGALFNSTLDVPISTRSTYAGGPVAAVTGDVAGRVLGGGASTIIGVGVDPGRVLVQSGLQRNTACPNFDFVMLDSVHHEPAALLTVTATRRIDGGAFAACANAATEVADGWYTINLAAADVNGAKIDFNFSAPGADERKISVFPTP